MCLFLDLLHVNTSGRGTGDRRGGMANLLIGSTLLFGTFQANGCRWPRTELGIRRALAQPRAMLLGDGSYRVVSPCAHETAALLAPKAGRVQGAHWVAVMPGINPLAPAPPEVQPVIPAFIANYESLAVVGEQPLAVGRLRRHEGVIELLASSVPKEDPQHAALLGVVLDHLLLAWLDHIAAPDRAQGFEALSASGSLHSASVLERSGFAEIESPDLSALGRGLPIATHAARLPAAIIAYTHRQQTLQPGDAGEAMVVADLLRRLREQQAPAAAATGAPQDQTSATRDDDPWSALRASSGY